jgi:acyl carrier protein
MEDEKLRFEVQRIFREILNQPNLAIQDAFTANDVAGWDSISHMDLLVALENWFRIKFTTAEISRLKDIGDLLSLIRQKVR